MYRKHGIAWGKKNRRHQDSTSIQHPKKRFSKNTSQLNRNETHQQQQHGEQITIGFGQKFKFWFPFLAQSRTRFVPFALSSRRSSSSSSLRGCFIQPKIGDGLVGNRKYGDSLCFAFVLLFFWVVARISVDEGKWNPYFSYGVWKSHDVISMDYSPVTIVIGESETLSWSRKKITKWVIWSKVIASKDFSPIYCLQKSLLSSWILIEFYII